MKRAIALSCRLGFAVLTAGLFAQGVGTSGDIRGTIRDSSGALLPNVTVTIAQTAKGVSRSAVTDSTGQFRISRLPPASYEVRAELPGFDTQVARNVSLSLGETTIIDFRLMVSPRKEVVEVMSEPPTVDTQRSSQANSVPDRFVADLPIDRRDYLTFALLMPGVSNSNTIADNADFRVKQTPQSGISLYGSNGRGNSVTVDGGEANDDAGGVRLNLSQDAVQEFQINRSNYSPEMGSASGASINIVGKSGSNVWHGSLFGFFRSDVFDARDPFALRAALPIDPTFASFRLDATATPIKNSLNRQQFGGTIGFPLKKVRTFLFLAYEGLRSDAEDSVPLLTHSSIFSPTGGQQQIVGALANEPGSPMVPCINPPGQPTVSLPSNLCALALQGLLTIDPTTSNPFVAPATLANYQFIVNQFEKDGGLFPFPTRQHQVSGRLDHHVNDRDQASFRYSYSHLTESDPDVQALIGFSRGTSVLNWDSTLLGSWFHQLGGDSMNELRLQWNWDQFNVDTNDPGGPGLDVQGYGFFGRGIFLPSHSTLRRYEFADNLSLMRGHHTMRMGFDELVRGNNTASDTFFSGRFEFLDLPGAALSDCLQAPVSCGLSASLPSASINTLQAWGLAAPAFYEQGFGNPVYVITRPFTAGYWQDTWQGRPNFTLTYGLRYEVDSQYGPLATFKKNFAPRASFAWDPRNDHKLVVRGGYGIFYSPIYGQIPNVVKTLGNINGVRQIANTLVTILDPPPANSAFLYSALFPKILCGIPPTGANSCITQSDLANLGLVVSNTGTPPPGTVLFFGQPDYRNPQSQQASLGVEREVARGLSVSLSYIYVHTTHLPWAIDKNLKPTAPIVSGELGANGLPTNGQPFQDWGAKPCVDPGLGRTTACFVDPTLLQNNEYASEANALYHGGIVELKQRFANHFTLLANYTYSKAIDDSTDFNSDYAAFNEVDLAAERSPSDFDQRHKVVVAAVVESPWQNRYLTGFQLAPVVSYNSGHPFNLLAGADINGDNHFTNDRPPGAPRNSGLGPNYAGFDLRLSKRFDLGEKVTLHFAAEGFNLTNRTNYASVNNVVGADFAPPFTVHGTATLLPSQPLAFTEALRRRELQLGVRLSF